MNIYIHTIDNTPAMFDGWQICYNPLYGKTPEPATSLKQIRLEQRTCIRNRRAAGLDVNPKDYGYRRYKVPTPPKP